MRNFLLLFLLTFILVALLPFYPSVGETKEHTLPDNEYVLNVMLGMGTDVLPAEALKAIAVTLRTYTAFHGKVLPQGSLESICASTSAEHGEKVYNAMREAVYSTTGEYITYGGKIINACFHLSSNQNTAEGGEPYLKSVSTADERSFPGFYGETVITREQILAFGKGEIKGVSYGEDGKAKTVSFEKANADVLEFINHFSVVSVDFTLHLNSDGGYTVLTKGQGNGLGLSLYGAYLLSLEGQTYKQIICRYFQGTEITCII
ncbi:MAG: hypothetical protein J6V84_06335 [Clostridia bacterium]|nr:hypothetical protein [Clostridia bacterium]